MNRLKKLMASGCCGLLLVGAVIPSERALAEEPQTHLEQVIEMDSTYEGFLANDEMLSFDEIASMPGASVQSEFDTLVELKNMTVSELKENGVEGLDIKKIQTHSVKEMVLDHAATLPKEQLKAKGLTDSTIKAIQSGNYQNITNDEVQAASSKLAFNIASCARAGASCNYSVYWHWDAEPLIKLQDTIATTISHNYWMTSNCTSKVGYGANGTLTSTKEYRQDPTSAAGASSRFDLDMARGSLWCQSGKAFVATLGSSSPSGSLIARAEYFHQHNPLPVDFSIGVGVGGAGVGITWTKGAGSIEGASTVYI